MTELELNSLASLGLVTQPKLYKRFVDDCFVRRNKSEHDTLFTTMNNYHANIELTCEVDPIKFFGY